MTNNTRNLIKASLNKRINNNVPNSSSSEINDLIKSSIRRKRPDLLADNNTFVDYDSDSMFFTGTQSQSRNILNGGVEESKARNQGWGWKAAAIIPRTLTKASIEVAKLVPTVVGIAASPFAEDGEGWETAFNNSFHKSLNRLNEDINDELLPVYVKKAVKDGNIWQNITSIDFYATEGADGLGFMLSMFAPGAILKAAGGANKLKGVIGGFEKGREFMQKAANLGLKMDEVGITMFNTLAEAGSEAGSQMQAMNDQKDMIIDGYIKQGMTLELAEKTFNDQKSRVGRDAFVLNTTLLAGTNFINTKMLGLAGDGVRKKVGNVALRNTEGEILDNVAKRGLVSRFKDIPKKAGTMFINEGLVEEGLQSTFENALSEKAANAKLTDGLFNDLTSINYVDEYAQMLSTTEGQKAIFLGGLLGYGSVATRSAKHLIVGREIKNPETGELETVRKTDDDLEIDRVNDILKRGREANNLFMSRINPDIYETTDEVDEDGIPKYKTDSQGKKIIDNVKKEQLLVNLQLTHEQGQMWDIAEKAGDEMMLSYLQNIAEARLIESFVADEADGINILSEYLDDMENLPADRKAGIMKKAEAIQQANEMFKVYSQPILNLDNSNAKTQDYAMFYNMLSNTNKMNAINKTVSKDNLDKANKQLDDLLSKHGLTTKSLDNNRLKKQLPQRDIRFKNIFDAINKAESELNVISRNELDIWDKKKQQKAFDEFVEHNNNVREKLSEENVNAVNEVLDNLKKAETVGEVNNAVNDNNEIIIDSENRSTTIDSDTQLYINTQAELKKQQLEEEARIEAAKQNINVQNESQDIINKLENDIRNVGTFMTNTGFYSLGETSDGKIEVINHTNSDETSYYDNIDDVVNHFVKASKVEQPVMEIIPEEEFSVDGTSTSNDTTKEVNSFLENENDAYEKKTSSQPTIKTYVVSNDGYVSNYIPQSMWNWINRIFNNKLGTKVTFSVPSMFIDGSIIDSKFQNQVDAYNALLNDNPNNLSNDFLIRNLPIQFNIDENTFAFIPTLFKDKSETSKEYIARKNLVRAIFKTKSYDGLSTNVQYQKAGKINSIAPVNGVETTNDISQLEEFDNKPENIKLYFVMDELGKVHNEKDELSDDLNSTFTDKQKGYIYTKITSHNGKQVPIKLNVRKLTQNQAELIYRIYKAMYNLKQSGKTISQKDGKLSELYSIDPGLKKLLNDNFTNEAAVFKNSKDIIIGEFMNLLIHDNLTLDGENKPYTTQYRGNGISFGLNGFVDFATESNKTEFIDFLLKNKRQNIKLDFLADKYKNVNSLAYKNYLISQKVLHTNLDVNRPFIGDINIYLDSNIKVESKQTDTFGTNSNVQSEIKKLEKEKNEEQPTSKPLENNSENTRNIQKDTISLLNENSPSDEVDFSELEEGISENTETKCKSN